MSRQGSQSPLWRAFEANEITHSAAHYLLAIASLTKEGRQPRAVDIARHLHVSRAAASLQLHSLQEHGLMEVDPSQHLHLTSGGADLVARVASKREVLRVFLSDVLRVRGATAEIDACKVEHLLSEETGAALVRWTRFLSSGHPAVAAFLDAFQQTTAHCPPGSRCELCTDACLLALGETGNGEGPRR